MLSILYWNWTGVGAVPNYLSYAKLVIEFVGMKSILTELLPVTGEELVVVGVVQIFLFDVRKCLWWQGTEN